MVQLKRDQLLIPCFCYGSNNIQQIRDRVGNNKIISYPCILPYYLRIFAGKSAKWEGGGVASIINTRNKDISCRGTYVLLTEEEFRRMNTYEGTNTDDRFNSDKYINNYRLEKLQIQIENGELCTAMAYIKNCNNWVAYPSMKYLEACYQNLKKFWHNLDGTNSIVVYDDNGVYRGEYFG